MKVVLLLLSTLLAVALVKPDDGFEPGKQYTYAYEAVYLTGVSAGRRYFATIIVGLENGTLCFKGKDLKTSGFNQKTDNLSEKIELDSNGPQKDPADVLSSLKSEFEEVFCADYKNGTIKAVNNNSNASLGAINSKKAIASLFQMDLKPVQDQGKQTYNLTEDGIGGASRTLYKVTQRQTTGAKAADLGLNVAKVRFSEERTHHPYMFRSSAPDQQAQSNRLGQTDYQLKGDANNYVMERINSTETIVFPPFSSHGETVMSIVKTMRTTRR